MAAVLPKNNHAFVGERSAQRTSLRSNIASSASMYLSRMSAAVISGSAMVCPFFDQADPTYLLVLFIGKFETIFTEELFRTQPGTRGLLLLNEVRS